VEAGQPVQRAIYPVENNFNQRLIDRVQTGGEFIPYNKISVEQKLKVALQMAEAIALLHGNKEGVIVNDDVQVDQWLLGTDGNIKLNDFNNALIPKWNPAGQRYCKFRVSYDYIFRSPQKLKHRDTDESADVFALGLIMYTILTGFMPFYERPNWDASIQALKDGEKPFIDPRYRNRSLIESRLVDIMEATWAYDIQDRVNVFQVVRGLRDTVKEYERHHPGVRIREIDLSNLPLLHIEALGHMLRTPQPD
jgi:serine/threonine protein kinase